MEPTYSNQPRDESGHSLLNKLFQDKLDRQISVLEISDGYPIEAVFCSKAKG
jgi:hypothetical protein